MTIVKEEETDSGERENDEKRSSLIKASVLAWLSKGFDTKIARLEAVARGELPSVSLHQASIDENQDREEVAGFYAAYFLHDVGPLFMCTLETIFDSITAMRDVRE